MVFLHIDVIQVSSFFSPTTSLKTKRSFAYARTWTLFCKNSLFECKGSITHTTLVRRLYNVHSVETNIVVLIGQTYQFFYVDSTLINVLSRLHLKKLFSANKSTCPETQDILLCNTYQFLSSCTPKIKQTVLNFRGTTPKFRKRTVWMNSHLNLDLNKMNSLAIPSMSNIITILLSL